MNSADPRPLKSIITICFIGSCVAMITGTTVALLMGATPQIAASILPKSVHYADCYGG
ncbi:LrgB family protein [Klebsiella pneumoniae]|nr:LrgB family protein [Klebsiella pneumoniae]